MKKRITVFPVITAVTGLLLSLSVNAQPTLYVPGGTVGNITGTNVGIGITAPPGLLSLKNQINPAGNTHPTYSTVSSLGYATFNSYYTTNGDGTRPYPRFLDIVSMGSPDGTNGGSVIRFLTNSVTNASSAIERLRVTSDGKIGIGITDPLFKLHVAGFEDANWLASFNNTGTNGHKIYIGYNATGEQYGLRILGGSHTSAATDLDVNGNFFVRGDGSVRIGGYSSNTTYKLDVAGTINATQYFVNGVPLSTSAQWQVSGSNIYYNSGKVGIGTNTPNQAQLDIQASTNNTALYLKTNHTVDYGYCIRAEVNRANTKAFVVTLNGAEMFKLNGNGLFYARGGWITAGNFPDYVFDDAYERASYLEKAEFFKKYKHLPQMKSAKEIEKNGLDLGASLSALTLNIEENSLDIIDLYKMIEELKHENEQLKKDIANIKK